MNSWSNFLWEWENFSFVFSDEASHILTCPFILNVSLILFLLLSNGSCFVEWAGVGLCRSFESEFAVCSWVRFKVDGGPLA